ncbi:cytochrome P450 [Gymnopus androsaceus JB14]|uniref:Cytochrome P450 n=1 Tax=Gymnopus androsaceus JB14 TaxID=1447944 RepID=A0A6A4H590_9AGAR|nr:cytochrome P450 [Gymnopus androsaceus JB14]
MMISSSLNWHSAFGIAIALSVVLLRRFLRRKSSSNGVDNLPGPMSPSWLTGNFLQVFNPNGWDFHKSIAEIYGPVVRLHGPFGTNGLYIFDPKAMHTVLVKEQDIFDADDGLIAINLLVFGNGLFGTLGHHHRKQRKMLNPVFSAAHMRDMIPTFFEVSRKLDNTLKRRLQSGPRIQEVDILSWMGRTALEIMGQAGLGYSFDPLTDDESAHPYSRIIKGLVPALMRMQFWAVNVLPFISRIGSSSFRRSILDLLPWKDAHHLRDMADYMYNVGDEILESKKLALEKGDEVVAQQIGRGKDLISILMKENMQASEEDRLDDNEVLSQMSTLTFAAMDTTSSAMARLLHLLSNHPEVQDKLRQELTEAKRQKDGQEFSYDELVALPYLDAVCRETLRLYPPASTPLRVTRQDAVIPLSKPITGLDGTEMHEIAIPKGTSILVSILNANRNADLWGKDANEWKPERWLAPLPDTLVKARIPGVYSHLMTFIGGGRSCIGFKFSQLEMKVVVSVLVGSFKFSPSVKDSEIIWQMNAVTAPIVGTDNHPQLPIGISLIC